MANNLSAVLPIIYMAADQVARELTGFVPASYRDSSAERAALNQVITYPIVGAMTASDITPAATSSSGTDQTTGSGTMAISKSRKVTFNWTGEEQLSVNTGDTPRGEGILRDQFSQAMRALVNEIETDLFLAAYKAASRATGTAGTTPFGTAGDLSDFANVLRILDENGAPTGDRHLVLGSAAMAKVRGIQSVLFKVNEAGTDEMLRQGTIGRVEGLNVHYSGGVSQITKGTGASYVTSGSTAVGITDIALVTGTGTVNAGDVVTFAADANNKYVVGGTGISAPGTISLNKPGARVVIATGNALTVGNSYTPNVAFDRNALHLITRAPAMPVGGDSAEDVVEVQDPQTGLAFQVALYRQYRQITYEVGIAWGTKAVKSDFIATLLG